MTDHPITPSLELAQQWLGAPIAPGELSLEIFTRAAQWGANTELEECCAWLREAKNHGFGYEYGAELARKLRATRRPKPPSLKEQALELARPAGTEGAYVTFGPEELALIRRALEALPDD